MGEKIFLILLLTLPFGKADLPEGVDISLKFDDLGLKADFIEKKIAEQTEGRNACQICWASISE